MELVSENCCDGLMRQGMWSCLPPSGVDVSCWFSSHFSLSRCLEPQEGLASLIHNKVGGSEHSSPTHLHWRQFPSKWGVREGNFSSSFFQGFPFLSSGPPQESFIFLPEAPNQLLHCSFGHLQPGPILIKHKCSWEPGIREANHAWGISHSSDSSQGTPIFKKCLDAFLINSQVGFSLQNKDNLCNLFPFLICLVEVRLSSWCWGARARHCSGGKKQACQETM